MPNNLQPTLTAAKQAILNFAQSMVSHSTLNAIRLILSPCCPTVVSVDVSCGTTDYDITLTLGSKLSLSGKGKYKLFIAGQVVAEGDWVDNTNSITLENVVPPASPADVQLQLFLPTDTVDGVGVVLNSNIVSVTFPAC